jgi:hypothetical protein
MEPEEEVVLSVDSWCSFFGLCRPQVMGRQMGWGLSHDLHEDVLLSLHRLTKGKKRSPSENGAKHYLQSLHWC